MTISDTNTSYYYPLKDYNASYDSIITQDNINPYEDAYTYVSSQDNILKKVFYTALGRERHGTYKSIVSDNEQFEMQYVPIYTLQYQLTSSVINTNAFPHQIAEGNDSFRVATAIPLTNQGYEFVGWTANPMSIDTIITPGTTLTGGKNIILYPVWKKVPKTIEFNHGLTAQQLTQMTVGTLPATQSIDFDGSIVIPSGPTLRNKSTGEVYEFVGWSTTLYGGVEYQVGSRLYPQYIHTILYARWAITDYTVTFDTNGSTSQIPAQKVKEYKKITLPSLADEKRSNGIVYRFAGWSTSRTATVATYKGGTVYTPTGNVTLYAVWKSEYMIVYDANGGSGAPQLQIKYHGEGIPLSTKRPTRTAYTFLGWSTSPSATTAQYQPGQDYMKDEDVTLYAVWKLNRYILAYNPNGGGGSAFQVAENIGTSMTLRPANTFTAPSGTHFLHWNTRANGTGTAYNPGASYIANSDSTVYAVWQEHTSACRHKHQGSPETGGGCYTVGGLIQVECEGVNYWPESPRATWDCGAYNCTGTVSMITITYYCNLGSHGEETWAECDTCGDVHVYSAAPSEEPEMHTISGYTLGCGMDESTLLCGGTP